MCNGEKIIFFAAELRLNESAFYDGTQWPRTQPTVSCMNICHFIFSD